MGRFTMIARLLLMLSVRQMFSAALLEQFRVRASMNPATRRAYSTSRVFSGSNDDLSSLDVVLFGIGDLRTDDHEGLRKAMESASNNSISSILPIVILDQKSLSNLPGVVAHTYDTSSMIIAGLTDLKTNLQMKNLDLHVAFGGKSLSEEIQTILSGFSSDSDIRIHVCDLGDADNSMGYSPFGALKDLPDHVRVQPWSCHLREANWSDLESLPTSYSDYSKQLVSSPPQPITCEEMVDEKQSVRLNDWTNLPTAENLCRLLQSTLSIDDKRCHAEQNTGMYGTHWGGLDTNSVGESHTLALITKYAGECREDDTAFAKVPIPCTRNPKSLEHAVMTWNMRGDGGSEKEPEMNNMMAGERLNRVLLAPLMLGTVSPRRVWHTMIRKPPFFQNPTQTLVETREWHKLLAARNMRMDAQYRGKESGSFCYKYWRWQGFLCRYLESDITTSTGSVSRKEGVVLVHGFGASGTQWTKAIQSLSNTLEGYESHTQCLAPDLIGFGQSEKPPITYAGYTWEAHMSDFIKEVAVRRCEMDSFIIGGNSIGGFVSICSAANDATNNDKAVSGNGAPGTGKCNGAVLMNPAGVIQPKQDVVAIEQVAAKNGGEDLLRSVAQVTAMDKLPPCKPLPRPVARAFGTGLLTYLRPRIQEICINLYPVNPAAVDPELCANILRDSLDPGAINVMISGSKLPTARTYNEVLAADFGQSKDSSLPESTFSGPILMAQGVLDPLSDAKGRAESLATLRNGISVDQLQGGHCPHDEIPDQVAESIARWMMETREERMAMTTGDSSMIPSP
eukprot:scaffold2141_cov120-Cylindrotheca_fusiformis.AAC.18